MILGLSTLTCENMSFLLEKVIAATGRASSWGFYPSLSFSSVSNYLLSSDMNWDLKRIILGEMSRPYNLSIMALALSSHFKHIPAALPRRSPSVLGSALLIAFASFWPISDLGRQLNEVREQDTGTSQGEMFPSDFLRMAFRK